MNSFQDSSSAVDGDENAFYEELARQILMLTDEDDDDKVVYSNDVELRRIPVVYGGVESRPVARNRNYYSWWETGVQPVPSWMESLWTSGGGGGTGVFIPSGATAGRHRKRSGRRRYNNNTVKNNDKGRVYSAVGQKLHG
ncbi:hypothetical protein L1987_16195 [Smallanthus sonchifolius]|uniref:Uncharacterized protein n=1 Tax=Smallanthus sonchifolius TaxID=185202 RepID=A0ACB9J9X6_9ASTR|nr:hypothetical protein L1987_16195 [Smallanthus sonchifolius]